MAARRKKARKASKRKTTKRKSTRRKSTRRKTAKKCNCPAPLTARPVGLLKSQHKQLSRELARRGSPMTKRDRKAARRTKNDTSHIGEFYD